MTALAPSLQSLTPRGHQVSIELGIDPAIIADWKAQDGPDDRTYQERLLVARNAHRICEGFIQKQFHGEVHPGDLVLFPQKQKLAEQTVITLPDQTQFIHLKDPHPLSGVDKERQFAIHQPSGETVARLISRVKEDENLRMLLEKHNRLMSFRGHIGDIPNINRSNAEVLLRTSTGKYRLISYQYNYKRGDLFDNILNHSLTPENKDQIIRTLLRSYAKMHRIRAYHMDAKPENVLLDDDPATPGRLKIALCDFDYSSVADEDLRVRGTLGYMPPDFFANDPGDASLVTEEQLAKADVWGLGHMIYTLLNDGYSPPLLPPNPRNIDQFTQEMRHLYHNPPIEGSACRKPAPDADPRLRLAWAMLTFDVKERPTMEEAWEFYQLCCMPQNA